GEEGVLWTLVNDDNEDAPLALEALAQGYAQVFRWGEALDCLNRLEKYWPDDAEVFLLRGWAHEALRHYESASSDFSRVLELTPTHVDAHMHLGEVLLASGLPEQAVGHLEKASAARPGEAGVLRN